MTNISNHFKLDEKFTITTNKHNWVLIEGMNTHNPHRHYYPNLEFLFKGLLDIKAKDSIKELSTLDSEISPNSNRIKILMDAIVSHLTLYVEEVTNEQKRSA